MRLIDADELKDWSEIVPLTGDGGIDINDFDEKLKSMPTVDTVPVIRCKDCRFRNQFGFCHRWLWVSAPKMEDDEYCSGAERKEE